MEGFNLNWIHKFVAEITKLQIRYWLKSTTEGQIQFALAS